MWKKALQRKKFQSGAISGPVVFQHACKLGLEGNRLESPGSRYRSGRSPEWLKFKNPEAPVAKREIEEDWS